MRMQSSADALTRAAETAAEEEDMGCARPIRSMDDPSRAHPYDAKPQTSSPAIASIPCAEHVGVASDNLDG
jgi:hypothetical protein